MLRLLLLAAWAGLWALPAAALDVAEVRWGFDGRVVVDQFNPVSMLLTHDGPAPFDGTVWLTRHTGIGTRAGGRQAVRVFLAAGASRWIRCHPYVLAPREQWRLGWQEGGRPRTFSLPTPRLGPPVRVELTDEHGGVTAAPRFPARHFPTTVVATAGLHSAVLGHTPSLDAAQRQALVDWVAAGGTLHLVPGREGELPALTDELAVLRPGVYGNGRVLSHADHDPTQGPIRTDHLDYAAGGAPPELLANVNTWVQATPVRAFRALRLLTRADHAWGLIYFLGLIYLFLIVVVNGLVGRRNRRYGVSIALFLGLVALFGWLFSFVGSRGYGEQQQVNAIAYCRPLGDGRVATTAFADLFVTRSGRYRIQHDTPHAIYSTAENDASLDAVILGGPGGQLDTTIPLYSARSFVFGGVLDGPQCALDVEQWGSRANGARLRLRKRGEWPKEILGVFGQLGGRVFAFDGQDTDLLVSDSMFATPQQLFNIASLEWDLRHGGHDGKVAPAREVFRRLGHLIASRAVQTHEQLPGRLASAPYRTALDVFVVAEAPAGVATPGGPPTRAYAVYHRRLWRQQ